MAMNSTGTQRSVSEFLELSLEARRGRFISMRRQFGVTRRVMISFMFVGILATNGYASEDPPKERRITQLSSEVQALLKRSLDNARSIRDHIQREEVLRKIASVQAKIGDIEGAVQTVQSIKLDLRLKDSVLLNIAKAQATKGDIQGALRTARSINNRKRAEQTRIEIIIIQADNEDIEGSLNTAQTIEDDFHRSSALQLIAKRQIKMGDLTAAKKIMEKTLQDALSLQSKTGMGGQLATAAEEQAAMGDIEGALQTAALIQENLSKQRALQRIAIVQAESGDVEGARKTMSLMSLVKPLLQNESQAGSVLGTIVKVQAAAGKFEEAFSTASTIKDEFWKVQALVEIARARVIQGVPPAAARTFQQAIGMAKEIDNSFARTSAVSNLAVAQADVGDIGGALKTLALIDFNSINDMTLLSIVIAQVKAEDLNGALHTAASIRDGSSKNEVFRAIARVRSEAGDVKGAVEWSEKLDSPEKRAMAFLGIAQGISNL